MAATASPTVSSTIGLKNVVIAPLTVDTETECTYGTVQAVAGAIEATITPENADPDVQYADDIEFDVIQPDPEKAELYQEKFQRYLECYHASGSGAR